MKATALSRFVPFIKRLKRDDDAVVAIQVVIFSVMLLSSAGLVIDFGRAYSAHSQMQSFVDKAALAAANELDGDADAIDRATNAAVGIAQSSTFTDGDGDFSIAMPPIFMVGNPVDSTGSFSTTRMAELATTNSAFATHVYVQAEARSIRLAFLSVSLNEGVSTQVRKDLIDQGTLFLDIDGDGVADASTQDSTWREALKQNTDDGAIQKTTSINLTAFAVARMQISYCGEISTMVMCNPFENDSSGRSFAEIMKDQEGTRMMLTTDRSPSTGVPVPLGTNDGAIRVGLFKNPHDEVGADAAGVCSGAGLRMFEGAAYNGNANPLATGDPWTYPSTDEELERLRDTCLLATIDSQMQCIGGEVLIKPAEPETITTALNTLFDIWDAPLDRVLTQAVTTGRDFAPDYVAPQGRLTRTEWQAEMARQLATKQAEVDTARSNYDSAPFFLKNARLTILNARNAEYAAMAAVIAEYPDNIANTASRRNHLYGIGTGTSWGPVLRGGCLNGSGSCAPYQYIQFPFADPSTNSMSSLWRAGYPQDLSEAELAAASGSSGGAGDTTEGGGTVERDAAEGGGTVEGDSDGAGGATRVATLETEVFSLGVYSANTNSTGWMIYNYTDTELVGNFAFSDGSSSSVGLGYVQIAVPAQSKLELQTERNANAVLTWNMNHGLDNQVVTANVDSALSYPGMTTNYRDLNHGRTASYTEYFAEYYQPYMAANGLDLDRPSSSFEWTIAAAQTMYEGYSLVERQTLDLLDYAASGGPEANGGGIRTLPEHYQFTTSNPSSEQTVERRRQHVALVNCGALSSPVSTSGVSDAYSGAYVAELEAVVDLFITEPVVVQDCASTIGSDPQDQKDCWNSEIDSALIVVEYLGAADPADPTVQEYINYAVLVH